MVWKLDLHFDLEAWAGVHVHWPDISIPWAARSNVRAMTVSGLWALFLQLSRPIKDV